MNKRVKKLWLEALRSGEYKQGRSALRDEDNNFCCLGVLCNLHAQAHPEIAAKEDDKEFYLDKYSTLPVEVAEWADLAGNYDPDMVSIEMPSTMRSSSKAGGVSRTKFRQGSTITLAQLNDNGFNFRQIADVIEAAL